MEKGALNMEWPSAHHPGNRCAFYSGNSDSEPTRVTQVHDLKHRREQARAMRNAWAGDATNLPAAMVSPTTWCANTSFQRAQSYRCVTSRATATCQRRFLPRMTRGGTKCKPRCLPSMHGPTLGHGSTRSVIRAAPAADLESRWCQSPGESYFVVRGR